jgi:penicillin-binding protein-related factor A (putative recombinase)
MKNSLEMLFDFSYNALWHLHFFCIREVDFPLYLIQKSHLRFKPHQIVDRILVSFNQNFAFELKHSLTRSLALSRIKSHQTEFLDRFQTQAGKGFFIFSFEDLDYIFLIPISSYLSFLKNWTKKSLNIEDIRSIPHVKEIQKVIIGRKKKPIMDLGPIFQI